MKLKGINSSSKKTINLIKKTFVELMEEKKSIENITVTELVKRANITRGTFYAHFDNIYDVASTFQEEILETVFKNEIIINNEKDLDIYLDQIFDYLKENEVIYSKLSSSNEAMLFMKKLDKKIATALTKNLSNPYEYLNILFFSNGTINLIIQYFKGEINKSLDEIFAYIKQMAHYLFFK